MLLILLLACNPDPDDTASIAVSDTAQDCADVTNWTTVGAPFVYTWCTPCHSAKLDGDARQGAPAGMNFSGYSDVVAYADRIEARVFSEGAPMPPAGGPTAEELADVAAWLSCGLPE